MTIVLAEKGVDRGREFIVMFSDSRVTTVGTGEVESGMKIDTVISDSEPILVGAAGSDGEIGYLTGKFSLRRSHFNEPLEESVRWLAGYGDLSGQEPLKNPSFIIGGKKGDGSLSLWRFGSPVFGEELAEHQGALPMMVGSGVEPILAAENNPNTLIRYDTSLAETVLELHAYFRLAQRTRSVDAQYQIGVLVSDGMIDRHVIYPPTVRVSFRMLDFAGGASQLLQAEKLPVLDAYWTHLGQILTEVAQDRDAHLAQGFYGQSYKEYVAQRKRLDNALQPLMRGDVPALESLLAPSPSWLSRAAQSVRSKIPYA